MKAHTIKGNNGVRLNVLDGGNSTGPSILFVHGWSQSHLCWSKQLASPLAERFRLIAMDIRGHGDSDKPFDGYDDPRNWAEDVQAVLEARSVDKAVLVGWSYGGLIMNDYLRHFGEGRLAGLCYVSAATDLGIETPYEFLGNSWNGLLPSDQGSVAGTVFSENADEATSAMRAFVRGCFLRSLPLQEEMMMLGANLLCPSRVRLALFSRVLENDDILAQITVPVLVSHGEADEVVKVHTGHHIASTARDAAISVYPGVGHAPFWEEPLRFNEELADFVSSVSARVGTIAMLT